MSQFAQSEPAIASVDDSAKSLESLLTRLSPAQQAILGILADGHSYQEAAQRAGINRTTLYRWMTREPLFRAAYNAYQKESRDSVRHRMLKISDDAVVAVGGAVRHGDEKLAYRLLKDLGFLSKLQDQPIEPQIVQQQIDRELRQEQRSINVQAIRDLLEQEDLTPRQKRQLLLEAVELSKPTAPAVDASLHLDGAPKEGS
jgi:hypothetical protein